MGSKGTTTQQGAQTYTANPAISAAGSQALGMAQNAVQAPFSLPVQQYAGFTPQQQAGFDQTAQYAQAGQPYFQQANQYFNQSASPISGQQINQYLNPYAGYVLGNLAETQGQQMQDLTGRLTQQAGGIGGDRIAVGQAELARQQNLASGQTLSGIYGSALSAAQQDAQRQQAAGYGLGNLGATAQGAALQGAQANFGMGTAQQNLSQQQLNAQYANTLAQLAYPYQNAQFLSGITGGLAPALGGTTMGYQQTTPPPPSLWSALGGLGTAATGAAGLFGAFGGSGSPAYGGGSAASGDAYGGSSAAPLQGLSPSDYGFGYGGGGRIGYDDGGGITDDVSPLVRRIPMGVSGLSPESAEAWRKSSNYAQMPWPQRRAYDPFFGDENSTFGSNPRANSQYDDGGAVKAPDWMHSDPFIPAINMQPSQVHQPQLHFSSPSSGGNSASSIGSDLSSAFKGAEAIAPFLLASRGGAVDNPFEAYYAGGHYQSGGDVPPSDYSDLPPDIAQQMRQADAQARASTQNALRYQSQIPTNNFTAPRQPPPTMPTIRPDGTVSGFADGGDISLDDRFDPVYRPDDPRRAVGLEALRNDANGIRVSNEPVPLPRPRPAIPAPEGTEITSGPGSPESRYRLQGKYEPSLLRADDTSVAAGPPRRVNVTGGTQAPSPPPAEPEFKPTIPPMLTAQQATSGPVPYPDLNLATDKSRSIAKNPWLALMAAGFGMMGGTSPYAAVNIGKGAMEGVKTLEEQRKALESEEGINQRARQLAMEWEKHLDEFTKIKPAEQERINIAKEAQSQQRWQIVTDPVTGIPYWTKQGEKPVPALPGQPPPTSGEAAGAKGPGAPVIAQGATQPNAIDFSYVGPSKDYEKGPGPVFNPKTGTLTPEHVQLTRAAIERADKAGEAANDAAVQLGQLKTALDQVDQLKKEAGGLLQTGAYAKERFAIAKTINGILAPLGIQPISPELIGSSEEINKLSTRLGFALSRTLGAREAQQIVQQAISANPGIENTPEGRKFIMATMEASIQRQQEYQKYVHEYRRQWRSAVGAEEQFNRDNPPEKYITRAAVETAAPQFRNPEQLKKSVDYLRQHRDDPKVVETFNRIYHNTAPYFLKGVE